MDLALLLLIITQIAVAVVYLIVFPILIKREHDLEAMNRILSAEIVNLTQDMWKIKSKLNNLIIDLDKELDSPRRKAAIEDLCKTCICRIRFDMDGENESL